jgi:RNA polymerase sigma factor (sigma-70 family)
VEALVLPAASTTSPSLLAAARLAGHPLLQAQTDERLVELARAGSWTAFEAIVVRYRRPLLAYCRRIVAGDIVEDVLQQTLVEAYAAFARGEVVLRLGPWLYRIAHNTALNALRDRFRGHEALDEGLSGPDSPSLVVESREHLREVLSAVQALPANQRDALLMRELGGRSHEEIARELRVTRAAVRQLLYRARSSVRSA